MRMPRQLAALLVLAWVALASTAAWAQSVTIAVVDFQSALNQVQEGTAVKAKLDSLYKEKKGAIDQMETQLKTMQEEYQKQSLILSDAARQQKEAEMQQAQMVYQQTYMQSEQEMNDTYNELMAGLISKMRTIAEQIGKEKGYTLILEATEGGVVYNGGAVDITSELVKRYDAANPKK